MDNVAVVEKRRKAKRSGFSKTLRAYKVGFLTNVKTALPYTRYLIMPSLLYYAMYHTEPQVDSLSSGLWEYLNPFM